MTRKLRFTEVIASRVGIQPQPFIIIFYCFYIFAMHCLKSVFIHSKHELEKNYLFKSVTVIYWIYLFIGGFNIYGGTLFHFKCNQGMSLTFET